MFLAHFWSIFPILGAKNFFLENPAAMYSFIWIFSTPCQNLEKIKDTIPRNT